jgi:hypothetical protein
MTVLPPEVSNSVFHYEQFLRDTVSPSTRRHYGNVLWQFFMQFENHKRVEDFTAGDMRRYQRARQRKLDAELAIVRAYFDWEIAQNKRIPSNPVPPLKHIRTARRSKPPLRHAA